MPVRADAQTATQKWVTNLSNSTAAITRGVQSVTVSPGQLAANAADKWLAKVTQAQAKFKSRVGGVSLSDWQNAMTTYGIPRIAQGAQAKQGKMQAFLQDFLPYLASGVAKIDSMPSATLEDSINRMISMVRYNAAYKRSAGS